MYRVQCIIIKQRSCIYHAGKKQNAADSQRYPSTRSSRSFHVSLPSRLTTTLRVLVTIQQQSHVQFFATPQTAAWQVALPFTISQSLLRFMCIGLVMLSSHLILCHPLLLLPSIFPRIGVFCKWPSIGNFLYSITSQQCTSV